MDGILLEIYRDGKKQYLTIPFEYQYGPLMGPYKGSWQMGSPVWWDRHFLMARCMEG